MTFAERFDAANRASLDACGDLLLAERASADNPSDIALMDRVQELYPIYRAAHDTWNSLADSPAGQQLVHDRFACLRENPSRRRFV